MTPGTHHALLPARALRVHCPIEAATLAGLLAGRTACIEADPVLAAMLAIVRSDTPLGDFGAYRSVVELAPGWELFTPGADAVPTLGKAGSGAVSPTAILTLYIPGDAPAEALAHAIDAIMTAHPWEVPVIELRETMLVTRG
ncbi:hypothetical protein ACG3SL_01530 [Sphingomonas sp. CJ20]